MSAVATAVVGSAVIGGYVSSQNAKKAANASAKGADAASQVQWDMYDQSRSDQMPWLGTGTNALKQLAALNGVAYSDKPGGSAAKNRENFNWVEYLRQNPDVADPARWTGHGDTPGDNAWAHYQMYGEAEGRPFTYLEQPSDAGGAAANAPDYSAFYNSPDYQFAYDEGNRALRGSLAARGLSGSGRALKELTRYGQGMASQQLNTYRNALAAMAGVGQTTAANLGQQGIQTGQIVGQNTQNAADARASGYLGKANAWNNALNQVSGAAGYGYGQNWWSGDRSNSIINSTRPVGG